MEVDIKEDTKIMNGAAEGIIMEGNIEMEDINMEVDPNMEALDKEDCLDINKFWLKNANNTLVIYIKEFI